MNMRFFLTLTVFLFCQWSVAQDSDKIHWADNYLDGLTVATVESRFKAATKALADARDVQDRKSEAIACTELGRLHTFRSEYDRAMDKLIRALAIEDSLTLQQLRVQTYFYMAQVFKAVGDYHKAIQFLEQASLENESFNDITTLTLILNELGQVNALLGRRETAADQYALALEYTEQLNHLVFKAEILFHLGELQRMNGDYTQSLETFKRSLQVRRLMHDRRNEARCLNTIGNLYILMKNDERAQANFEAAIEIYQSLDDKTGLTVAYNNLGSFFYRQKQYDKAIPQLVSGLRIARDIQDQEELLKSYDYLSQCYRGLQNYEQALSYRDLYTALSDFLVQENSERQLVEKENRYVIDQKESQIDNLELAKAQRERELLEEKQFRNLLLVIIAAGAVIGVLILVLYRQIRRANKKLKEVNLTIQQQNEQLQQLNATKDKFFSIISHDLRGPLNSLTSFSGLLINHTDSLSKEEIQHLAKDLDKSLKNLFALLENLLEWSRSQTGRIEFTAAPFNINEVLEENKVLLSQQAQAKSILIKNNATDVLTVLAHRNSITTVVRNLVSNAIKFTMPEGTVTVDAVLQEEEVVVSVQDTGVGMPKQVLDKLFRIDAKHTTAGTAKEKGTGLGLILCKEFVEKNGGRIWVESEEGKGTIFYFTIKAQ